MNGSILTNQGAMVALQTMKMINKNLSGVQDMISTGKRVATSKDNAAIWAISSVMESDVSSFKAVTDSLALGQSTVAVARNAAEQVKDSLIEIKSKIIAAQEENVDRDKIQADVDAIRSQIKSIVGASQFNGLNLLKSGEDLEVLSSVDRSSNGSTTTSTINVEAKSLDSGTTADSVAGTSITAAVNANGATVAASFVTNTNPATVTDGKATLGTFTNSSQKFDFTTTTALDEGDSVAFSFTDGTNTATFTYTQTAVGTAQTTGEELAKQLAAAYTAFAARDAEGAGVNIGTGSNVGDYNATTKTFTAAEGTFVITGTGADNLNTLDLSESAGTLTVVNKRDTGVILTVGNEVDRLSTDLISVASATINNSAAANFTFGGTIGLQQDDSYRFELRNTDAGDVEELSVTVTGAALNKDQVATLTFDALQAFKNGDLSSTNTTAGAIAGTNFVGTTTAGRYTDSVTGASITLAYDDDATGTANGNGLTEAAFRSDIDGTTGTITFTNPSSGVINVANATGGTIAVEGVLTEGSADTNANIAVSNTASVADLTPSTQSFAFTTTDALDEGDKVTFSFTNGVDSFNVLYTQTAGGNAQTTGEELSAQLANAYTAFKAGTNVGDGDTDGDFVSSTNTYTGAEGTFVFSNGSVGNAVNLKNLTFTSAAGVLTVENEGTAALTFSVGNEVDYTTTTITATAANQILTQSDTATLDFTTINTDGTGGATNTSGLQADDTYILTIADTAADGGTGDANLEATEASVSFSITGAALTKAELADSIQRITDAYINGDISSASTTYGGTDANITKSGTTAGVFSVNGATITIAYAANGTALANEGAFQTAIGANLTVTNGASEQVVFTNSSATATDDYLIRGDLNIGTAANNTANFAVAGAGTTGNIARATGSGTNNIVAGTIGDYLTIDVNNTANQVGDTLSVTLAGVNEVDGVAQPITYTAANGATETQIATGFAAAINTALSDAGIRDVVASTRTGGLIDIKNYNITTTKEVKDLSVVNELTTAAVATDSNGVTATSIAAGATNKVTFGATKPTKGDTYKITVGSTSVSYTARKDDDLNIVGRNLEGLLKLKSNANITVDFTSADDPTTTNTVLTVKNNGTTAITSFAATVKSGGKAGGGLELLDDIDVTNSAKAEGSLDIIENLIGVAIDAASSYGSSEKRLTGQQEFISKLTDSLKSGIGSLVDANLEETSARLQALQVQQQLGTQALSIANQSPQSILSLFR